MISCFSVDGREVTGKVFLGFWSIANEQEHTLKRVLMLLCQPRVKIGALMIHETIILYFRAIRLAVCFLLI